MVIPLRAKRHGDGMVVAGLPELVGWTVTVHDDGPVTLTPPTGARVTQATWRAVPIGGVLAAADDATRDVRVAALVDVPPVTVRDRVPGPQRISTVSTWHRKAIAAGLTPRAVVAALYGVPQQTAGKWITEARAAGAITDGSER